MKEADLEELLRKNVELICEDGESMLIIGQQVRNECNGRSDLTAIDNQGNLVLIEIKRDRQDIVQRKEAFEFQAIRYAASLAKVHSTEDLVRDFIIPYIDLHDSELFTEPTLTITEQARRYLAQFLNANDVTFFNQKQRIILVASDFDLQTLLVVAWLSQNQLDVTCYKMTPYVDPLSKQIILDMQKILPVRDCSDFFIKVESSPNLRTEGRKEPYRRNLPKLREMSELQILEPGDILIPKGYEFEAELLENGNVMTEHGEMALSDWLKTFGWTSGNIYDCMTQK